MTVTVYVHAVYVIPLGIIFAFVFVKTLVELIP